MISKEDDIDRHKNDKYRFVRLIFQRTKSWVEELTGLQLSDALNVTLFLISLLALLVSLLALFVAIETKWSSDKSSAAQEKSLESAAVALDKSAGLLKQNAENTKLLADIQLQQYKTQQSESQRKPKVGVFFWNFKEKVPLASQTFDNKAQTRSGKGAPPPIELRPDAKGMANFEVFIINSGTKEMTQSGISISCSVPIETSTPNPDWKSPPFSADPNSGDWTIHFTEPLLLPYSQTGSGVTYRLATSAHQLFGCFVFIEATGLDYAGGGFLRSGNGSITGK